MAGGVFTYQIKTAADLRAFQAVEQSLIRQRAQAVAAGKDVSALSAKLARTQEAMAGATGAGKPGSGGLAEVGKQVLSRIPGGEAASALLGGGGAVAAVAAGFTAAASAVALCAKALADFAVQQQAVSDLDTVLANQGRLTDEYREKLQALAGEMEEATNIADDQWLGALTKLTQAGADSSNIDGYAEAVKNLSAITGGGAVESSQMWVRAMNGNFRALNMLGVSVDKNASLADKLRSAQEQLAQKGGGILENRLKTLTGQTATFGTNVGNLSKGLGNWANKFFAVQETLGTLNVAMAAWATLLPSSVDKVAGLGNALPKVSSTMDELEAATEKAKTQTEEFTEANKKSTAELDHQLTVIDKIRQRLDAQTDAASALALAQIDEAEASGLISGPTAAIQRAQTRGAAEQEKLRREVATLAEKQIVLDKAQSDELKGIAETTAEIARLEAVITEEKNVQSKLAKISRGFLREGAAIPEGILDAARVSGTKDAAAVRDLPGARELLKKKQEANRLAEEKRVEERADAVSGIVVAQVKQKTAGIEQKSGVLKGQKEIGPESAKKQLETLAELAEKRFQTKPTGMDINAPRSRADSASQLLQEAGFKLGATMDQNTKIMVELMLDFNSKQTEQQTALLNTKQIVAGSRGTQ